MSFHAFLMVKILDLGFCTAYFLYFALRSFITKKPFLFSTRWFFVFLLLLFLPYCIPVHVSTELNDISLASWIIIIMSLFVFSFLWKVFNGYTVYGITEESFRESLLSAFKKSNLKHKENIIGFHFKSYDAVLKATFSMGRGRIRMRDKYSEELLEKIVPLLKKELEKPSVEFSPSPALFSFGISVFLLIDLVTDIFLFPKLANLL